MLSTDAEPNDVGKMMDLYALLYYYLAREMVESFGEAGQEALRRAIDRYGQARGTKMRQQHETAGLPINLKTLFTNKDLPPDPRFRRNLKRLDETGRYSTTLVCPLFELWRELEGGSALGQVYCEGVHHAMWHTYDPRITVGQPKILTRGDDCCEFEVVLHDEEQPDASS